MQSRVARPDRCRGTQDEAQIEPDARLVDFRYRLGWQLPDDLQSQLEELGVVFQS